MGLKSWLAIKALQGKLPAWVYTYAGKKIGKIMEDKMEDSKKWYLSKTVISDILTALIGAYMMVAAAQPALGLPPIPAWVLTFLGAIGIYGRVTATTTVTK